MNDPNGRQPKEGQGHTGATTSSTTRPSGSLAETEREAERAREDVDFTPVIVKRTDEARRHPDDILQSAIDEGLEQLNRPSLSLALSSMAAGLIVGFTAMSVGVVQTSVSGVEWPMFARIATALVYPLGFVACLMSGAELFTEHTATAVYPVLDRRSGLVKLLRLWVIVVAGNLLGTAGSALLLTLAEDVVGARAGYLEIGRHLVSYDSSALIGSAVLAGWLMALGGWLILATPPRLSQVVLIYVVTFLIGLGGLHHSIAGTAELLAAWFNGAEITSVEGLRFVLLAIVGNVIGGSLFVAGLNYAHIRKTRR